MTNVHQATIQKQLTPAIKAYLGLITDPNYFNEVLGINPSKLPVSIGAHRVGAGTFSIEHNTDVFDTDPELNAQRVSSFAYGDFQIHFFESDDLDSAGIVFNQKEFFSYYDVMMQGLPQFLYNVLFYLIENKIYHVEGALAIFGSLLNQFTDPYGDQLLDEGELRDTETNRLLGVHFGIVAAIQHDLEYSKKQHQPAM